MYVGRGIWSVYNEIDEYAADWLENLIAVGAIAPGVVDRRSIVDVRPDDYREFRQAHFFAGIGVWSYSLRRAGVPDDVALWTGSCPCQPFSAAGAGGGLDDERHLWPHWFHLIGAVRPPRIYGEQVASKDGLGWLDLVCADLEGADYSVWAVDTCSASGGAPHIRQRLRICADDLRYAAGGMAHCSGERWNGFENSTRPRGWNRLEDSRGIDGLEHGVGAGLEGLGIGHRPATGQRQGSLRPVATAGGIEWVPYEPGRGQRVVGDALEQGNRGYPDSSSNPSGGLADNGRGADELGCGPGEASGAPGSVGGEAQQWEWGGSADLSGGSSGPLADTIDRYVPQSLWGAQGRDGAAAAHARTPPNRPSPTNGFWRDADWLFCRDAKWRPTEPGTFPLVDGSAFRLGSGSAFEGKSRQGMLKGYGNAIDAEATIDFVEATLEPGTIDVVARRPVTDLSGPLA